MHAYLSLALEKEGEDENNRQKKAETKFEGVAWLAVDGT